MRIVCVIITNIIELIIAYTIWIESHATLSTPELVSVCPGEQLAINCSDFMTGFIEWNVTVVNNSGSGESRKRLVASNVTSNLTVNGKSFQIRTNIGSAMASGITSTLSTTITPDLNGTVVRCTEVGGSHNVTSSSTTTVHVIRSHHGRFMPVSVLVEDASSD